jgi:hypothetical protein
VTTSALVPGLLPVAIHGHPYLAEPTYERETVQVIRQQADTSTEAGEQSLTPLGLWRRSQESWHHGAGQPFLDGRQGDEATDPHRFRSSKGLDVWTKGQVSLLNKTLRIWPSANTNLALLYLTSGPGGLGAVYVVDGTEIYWTRSLGNLLSYNTSSIETDTSGWQTGVWSNGTWGGGGNTTLARSTAWAYSSAGAASLELTPVAAGTITAGTATGTSGVPVEPGRRYIVHMWMRAAIAPGRENTISLDWYDAAGAWISTVTSAVPSTDNNTGNTGAALYDAISSEGAVAPATAAYAAVRASFASVAGATDIHRIDAIFFGPQRGNQEDVFSPMGIQAGQAAQTVKSVTTDGFYIWAALGISGLHRTVDQQSTSTADVPAAPAGGCINLVGYAAPFLLAAGSAVATTTTETLWLVSNPISAPTLSLIKTHPSVSFVWAGIASGRNCVYAWGNNGGTGEVYKILFDPNTGSLATAASLATYLPDGETIYTLIFYAGGVVMGTGKGLRIGTADGAGNIDYGPLIATPYPVRCLEPQDRYVWFGWSNYDSSSTGLGRVDLGFLTDTLTPTYASDLMAVPVTGATVQGEVLSAVTYTPWASTNNTGVGRVFAVSGIGVYMEDTGLAASAKVASGNLQTGTIRFSTSEPKTARSLDVRHHALPAGASVATEMQRESSGTWTSVGSSSTTASYGPATPLDLQDLAAEALEFRLTLARATDISTGPELTRWTAKVLPVPSTIDETFTFTLHMKSAVDTTAADGQPYRMDVPAEVAFLKALEQSRQIVEFQVAGTTFEGYVLSSKFAGEHWNSPKREFAEGKLQLTMQTARG